MTHEYHLSWGLLRDSPLIIRPFLSHNRQQSVSAFKILVIIFIISLFFLQLLYSFYNFSVFFYNFSIIFIISLNYIFIIILILFLMVLSAIVLRDISLGEIYFKLDLRDLKLKEIHF